MNHLRNKLPSTQLGHFVMISTNNDARHMSVQPFQITNNHQYTDRTVFQETGGNGDIVLVIY